MTKTIDKNRARQGRDGTRVLIVLVCALILTALVWAVLHLFSDTIAPEPPAASAPTETIAPTATPPSD